ncbi:pilus assembly protein FimV [Burkholderia sp. JSH-S8]|nr:pilus assembly protein FimV [Burkholderia sp. JSH-S8]
MSRISMFPRQSRLSRAVCGALAILALGAAASTWAAGDTAAAEAGAAVPLTVTVQPGQSLNDLAKAATQSSDPGVLARAGRALFDANPQAFMKRDPSRLKVGATLTLPALDATGAAVASGAAAASGAVAASAAAASGAHAGSAVHPASAAQATSAASAAHAVQPGDAHVAPAAGASAAVGASAGQGASAPAVQPASPAAGASSGPHVWSGAIQSAPPSASDAVVPSAQGGMAAAPNAAPAAAASQPRPSSLQQLLALKNRVLMELQKHGIGKPGATAGAGSTQAPAAPRAAANDAGASAAASNADTAAASGVAASAAQPETAPARPAVTPAPAPAGAAAQIDWRVASAAGAAVLLVAGFLWRKRRSARRDEAAAAAGAGSSTTGSDDVSPSPVQELPIQPEMPVSRDAAADVHLAAATAAAAETEAVETHVHHDAPVAPVSAEPEQVEPVAHAHDAPEAAANEDKAHDEPVDAAPAAQSAADTHHSIMQSAITALGSLDMPLPPRVLDESTPAAHETATTAAHSADDQGATNGQSASRLPIGAADPTPEHLAEQDDEPEWDDGAFLHGRSGATSSAPAFAPLGGAQFGALKLDFDLDLPSAPGAALPALTPDELARIARNKLDLASEYVELGDVAGARTLLQEVVDANDAATRDDARALLAKLAAEA